jgi:hypothetical protein
VSAFVHCPTPPPTDGQAVLIQANVAYQDGACHVVEPAFGRMRFKDGEWLWAFSGMNVRQFYDAELHILQWHAAPQSGRLVVLLNDPRRERFATTGYADDFEG